MVFGGLYEEEGRPFTGRKLEKVRSFLESEGLSYDETVEYTLLLVDEDGRIAATGSAAGNVLKCIAVDDAYQGEGLSARIVTGLTNYCLSAGKTHLFIFTKPKNRRMFADLGFEPVLSTDEVLFMENRRNGIGAYVEVLKQESRTKTEAFREKEGREPESGAIVANCNPFTYGHAWLISEALKQCDLLHLFILSEDRSDFAAKERFEMVRLYLEAMEKDNAAGAERVILHETSDYLISQATFPTYFIRDKAKAEEANCELDIRIFAERIAKPLNITRRFAGSEPDDGVTNAYNRKMEELLPVYGIEFIEIPRKEIPDAGGVSVPVSAKRVRTMLAAGDLEGTARMVPESTLKYLEKRNTGEKRRETE